MIRSILVLETPWDDESVRSTSVWPFLSEFARVVNVEAFHQTFSDRKTFDHWVQCFHRDNVRTEKLLYVAAHGSVGRIGALKQQINGKNITSALSDAKSISHVHFGSCFFGTASRLRTLVEGVPHLRYAAGYAGEIAWIESMALDLLMLNRLVSREEAEKHARTTSMVRDLVRTVDGLSSTLGFSFAYRYGGERVFSSPASSAA